MFVKCYPEGCSPEEFQRLLVIRRETLEFATGRGTGGDPLPIPWRSGWKASLSILGRSRDGSLRARVVVEGPKASYGLTRKVRLVRPSRLSL